jgi:hypothetical protein
VADNTHAPPSELKLQSEAFRNCFKPVAYRLEKNFSWMTDAQRAELGRKADEALKQVYIDQFSEMYGTEEPE